MIYTDGIHLIGETVAELHEFAARVGIKRCWFDSNPKHPHYDLRGKRSNIRFIETQLTKALDNGAMLVTDKQLLTIIKAHYGND